MGSGGTIAQEMIDLVDNLIDKSNTSKSPVRSKPEVENFGSMISSYGILKYDQGNIYEGQLLNGKRSGNGKMIFSNGDKYVGMWKTDQMCDHEGVYTFKNGNEYRGSFKTCSKLSQT